MILTYVYAVFHRVYSLLLIDRKIDKFANKETEGRQKKEEQTRTI